eukprot:664008-Prorocentrum_minimum.AAC.1
MEIETPLKFAFQEGTEVLAVDTALTTVRGVRTLKHGACKVACTWEEENIWGGKEDPLGRDPPRRGPGKERRRPPTPPEQEHYTAPGPGLTPGVPGRGRWRQRLSEISSVGGANGNTGNFGGEAISD